MTKPPTLEHRYGRNGNYWSVYVGPGASYPDTTVATTCRHGVSLADHCDACTRMTNLAAENLRYIPNHISFRKLLIEVYNHGENSDLHRRIGEALGARPGEEAV
jgi:hypothetical protein